MSEQHLTGYPSVDRPWLKYYTEEMINAPLPECTIYEYLYNNNKEHLGDVALMYFGRKITYKTLFDNIEKAASAFVSLGIKRGDIVTIQALSLPQVVYILYALSKIGAIANMIYATSTVEEVRNNLIETKSKLYVTMDSLYDNFNVDIKSPYLRKTVLLSVSDEMGMIIKTAIKIKSKADKSKDRKDYIDWKTFLAFADNKKASLAGAPTDAVIMIYTGGTTGKSKGVLLSNNNLNVGVRQYLSLGFERGKTFLCVLPPFIAFGLTVTIHMPLSFGLRTALCVSANPTEISDFVEKYKPNYLVCGTAQAEKMMNDLEEKNTDLSTLTFLGVGGDALSLSLETRINTFLEKHNSPTKIIQGYAMSETSASSTAAIFTIHKQGTVGIPFVYTTIKIVNTDTYEELSYLENGEICINSSCIMMGYYQNEEETNNILKLHKDGKIWVHTGDIGNMDKDGFITIVGRMKRMILTFEGDMFHKVFPKLIEDKFLESGYLQAISIVGKQNKERANDLVAFVVPTSDMIPDEVIAKLKDFAKQELENYEQPIKYIIKDKLPLTTVGKVDYRKLEDLAATF